MIHFQVSRRLTILVLAVIVIALTVTGCRQKPALPPEKITIAYSTASNAMLTYIAFAKGYLAEEGLEATPQPHAFGKPALQSVIDGKADIATVGDTPIVFAVMNGKKITTLAMIQTSNRNEAIVARQDRGITKPSDLKGKKIGLTPGTTGGRSAKLNSLRNSIPKKRDVLQPNFSKQTKPFWMKHGTFSHSGWRWIRRCLWTLKNRQGGS